MPETIKIMIDPDGKGSEFDKAIRGPDVLPECGDLRIVTKNQGTQSGRAIACITFTVTLPDGTRARAQTVNTVRNLANALRVLAAVYPRETSGN
jgi:hypothetical protein